MTTLATLHRQEGIQDELRYWDEVLRTHDQGYPECFAFAFEPKAPLQGYLQALFPPQPHDEGVDVSPLKILDVGAGPYTTIGKIDRRGRPVEITAIDPLGDEYAALLEKHGLRPPLRTKAMRGEDIPDHYAPATFDLVHARNSLDHSEDPMRIIRHMMTVARVGGGVFLQHRSREADRQLYQGLHQWNFDFAIGRMPTRDALLLEPRRGPVMCVDDELHNLGFAFEATHRIEDDPREPGNPWQVSIFRKTEA